MKRVEVIVPNDRVEAGDANRALQLAIGLARPAHLLRSFSKVMPT